MLKISVVDSSRQRTLVVEGALVAPWTSELASACEAARAGLDGRELVVAIRNLLAISGEGENVLVSLVQRGIRLRSHGVFAKHLLAHVVRKSRGSPPRAIVK